MVGGGCGRCASTTSSCCSPTAPSASSGCWWSCSAPGHRRHGRRLRPAGGPRRLQGGAVHGGGDARQAPRHRAISGAAAARAGVAAGGRRPRASAASMAGLPLEAGFVAKEEAYAGLHAGGFAGSAAVLVGVVVGSSLTVAYSARMVWGVLVSPPPLGLGSPTSAPGPPSSRRPWPSASSPWCSASSRPSPTTSSPPPSRASCRERPRSTWRCGTVNVPLAPVRRHHRRRRRPVLAAARGRPGAGRRRAGAEQRRTPTSPCSGDSTSRPTGSPVVQNGSLPVYAGVVLLTSAVLPGAVLLLGRTGPGGPSWSTPRAPSGGGGRDRRRPRRRRDPATAVGGAVPRSRRLRHGRAVRRAGCADLALTQVAIETLSTVLFVLVLRHFPDRFEPRSTHRRRVVPGGVGHRLRHGLRLRPARRFERTATWCRPRWSSGRSPTATATTSST